VAPVVAEVEGVSECVAGLELFAHSQGVLIEPFVGVIGVEDADPAAVGELETVQVSEIPAREAGVYGLGQIAESVSRVDDKDPTGERLAGDSPASQ
jgi:hypothetical protein